MNKPPLDHSRIPLCVAKCGAEAGFTLIQLSIILTVASLIFVATLPGIQSSLRSSATSVTKMNAILNTMRGYMAANGYLPCPADPTLAIGASNYGVAAANSGTGSPDNCIGGTPAAAYADTTNHIALGMVPVKTLGLSYADALDGYGRDITYAVDTNATATCWASSSLTGAITVNDNGSSSTTIAALISHGADGYGAWLPLSGTSGTATRFDNGSTDTAQADNAQVARGGGLTSNTTFVSFIKQAATSTFDDSVVYKSNLYSLNRLPASTQQSTWPTITPPANGTYSTGQVLTFTITYPSNVTINTANGTPRLVLSALGGGTIGTSNKAYATYQSGSGTTTLTFSYAVQSSDSAPTSGLTMNASIDLNGGTLSGGSTCFIAPNLSQVLIGASCPLYRAITIDHTKVGAVNNTDQTNFPMLFAGTYAYLATTANGGKVNNSNGYDIKFSSDQAGNNLLSYEQESYTSTTGALNYWVKIPTLSHTTDTVIYLQYCTTNQTNQSNPTGLWGSSYNSGLGYYIGSTYQGVWHFGTGVNGSGTLTTPVESTQIWPTSSTYNQYAYNTYNKAVSTVTSPWGTGTGVNFNNPSYNGYLMNIGNENQYDMFESLSTFTVEAWVEKLASSSATYNDWVVSSCQPKGSGSGNSSIDNTLCTWGLATTSSLSNSNANNCPTLFVNSASQVVSSVASATCPAQNTWYHVAATRNGTTCTIYVNGVQTGQNTSCPSTLKNNGNTIRAGVDPGGTQSEIYLDEMRFSSTASSADWINTEYNNQSAPDKATYGTSGFYTVGTQMSR